MGELCPRGSIFILVVTVQRLGALGGREAPQTGRGPVEELRGGGRVGCSFPRGLEWRPPRH
jgi:hypothetical protein